MKVLFPIRRIVAQTMAAAAAFIALCSAAAANYDFDKAWKEVNTFNSYNFPRSITNKLDEILREALAAKRWPHYAHAFIARAEAMKEWVQKDGRVDWIAELTASVNAQPEPVQAVLQLFLAQMYRDVSSEMEDDESAIADFEAAAVSGKIPHLSPARIDETLDGLFAKVLAREAELKVQKVDDWRPLLLKDKVSDSYCPTLFDFAVRDMMEYYEHGEVWDAKLKKALALYDRQMSFHRGSGNVDALAMAELKRAEYIYENSGKPSDERVAEFTSFLDGFIARYEGRTSVVAVAAGKKAYLIEYKKNDGAAAHALALEYAKKWPGTLGGKICAKEVASLEEKSLDISVERNWCVPSQKIAVEVKNVRDIYFRLVPVTFEELIEDAYRRGDESYKSSRNALKDKYSRRSAVKTWKETLPLKPDYSEQKFRLGLPTDIAPGHYALYAATDDKFVAGKHQPLCAKFVTVTSLALVLQTGDGEFGGVVYNADTGYPVEGATVELWGYGDDPERRMKVREKYVTDREGRFSAEVPKGERGALNRHVRVVKNGEEVISLRGFGSGTRSEEKQDQDHVDLFTDRSLYRPGQKIQVKGIAYHADPDAREFRTLRNASVVVMLTTIGGKEITMKTLKTNKWGSFSHAFTAPQSGMYCVKARLASGSESLGETDVEVEEYKRPKFSVELEKPRGTLALGVPVNIKGRATTYSGLPVTNAKVKWSVERSTKYSAWWCRLNGRSTSEYDLDYVAKGKALTDENGVFTITFTPAASREADRAGDPSFEFEIKVEVTDDTGEEHSASESFEIGSVACRALVRAGCGYDTVSDPVPVEIELESLSGEKIPVRGTLKVFRLKAPPRPVRMQRLYRDDKRFKPWDCTTWESGEEALSLDIASSKADRWTGSLKLGAGAYRIAFETTDPGGKPVKDVDTVLVFDPAAKGLGIAVPEYFAVESDEVKVGETLRAYWGTGYGNGYCRVKVTSNGKPLLDRAVSGESPKWLYELPIRDEHRGLIRIETLFVKENSIYCNCKTVYVPWESKCLKITAEHMTSRLTSGKNETWKFKVSGFAEVLAFMYDISLDSIEEGFYFPSLEFSRFFTPQIAPYREPALQNGVGIAYSLDFDFRDWSTVGISWPTWNYCKFMVKPFLDRCNEAGDFGSDGGNTLKGVSHDVRFNEASAAADSRVPRLDNADCDVFEVSEANEPTKDQTRRNLDETAFFFPHLETDADGNVSFTFTAPDALAGWKFFLLAHDNSLNGGVFCRRGIVTTKPLMCEPNAPRFVREGDDFLFPVKVTNRENKPQSGVLEFKVQTTNFKLQTLNFSLAPREAKTFEFRLRIPEGCGDLKYIAKAKSELFADGEEGRLPVLSRRVMVSEAVQLSARGNETKKFRLENLVGSKGSDTIRYKELTVRAVSHPEWYAVLSLPYLMEFPHECCEQTFSRYFANVVAERVVNSGARVQEAFDAAGVKGGELFDRERLGSEQSRCRIMLYKARNDDELWPWFPGGPSSKEITLYILTGFARLGCPSEAPEAIAALDEAVSSYVKRRIKDEGASFRVGDLETRWLYLHSFAGIPQAEDEKLAPLIVEHLRKEWTGLCLEVQALAAVALKRMGEEALARKIMASVKERAIVSEESGMHWNDRGAFSTGVFSAAASAQAAAMEAFREVTGDEASVEACRVWLLKERRTQGWGTTAATADAVYALLLGGGHAGRVTLPGGGAVAEVAMGSERVKAERSAAETGMYSVRYAADAIRPEMGEIEFKGAGGEGVSWGGVVWTYYEDALKVRAHEPKELRVERRYFKRGRGKDGPKLVEVEGALEPGDEIVARLVISSDRAYECVHVSDERPACAEPVDVISQHHWRGGAGYYQTTRDTATHYYIERLKKGRTVIETSYRVQQSGTFSSGLATIECMYAPEFTAHSAACERTRVKRALQPLGTKH